MMAYLKFQEFIHDNHKSLYHYHKKRNYGLACCSSNPQTCTDQAFGLAPGNDFGSGIKAPEGVKSGIKLLLGIILGQA